MSNVQSGKILGSLLPGDTDPSEFDMGTYLTRETLKVLLVTSAPIQKQCIWQRFPESRPTIKLFNLNRKCTIDEYIRKYRDEILTICL